MDNISVIPSSSVSESLGKSWQAVIANVLPMIGFTFVYYLIKMLAGKIPGLGMLTNLFSFIYTVSMFSAFHHIDTTGRLSSNAFFNWTPKFGKLFLANIIMLIAAVIIFIPLVLMLILAFGTAWFSNLFEGSRYMASSLSSFSVGFFLTIILVCFIGAVLLMILTFALHFIVLFKDLSISDSLKLSWKVGRSNIGQLLLFLLLTIGVAILGTLALVIGLLVAIPVIVGMQYYFLRSIFPESETANWDFMKEERL